MTIRLGGYGGGLEPGHLGLAPGAPGASSRVDPAGGARAGAVTRYRWSGSGFGLVDHVEVANDGLPGLTVTTSSPSLALTPGGPAHTVEVTVGNEGSGSPRPVRLDVTTSAPVAIQVEGLATSRNGPRHSLLIPTPDTGQTVTITLRVALLAGAALTTDSSIAVIVRGAYVIDLSSTTISLVPA